MKKEVFIKKGLLLVAYLLYATSLFAQKTDFTSVLNAFETNKDKQVSQALQRIDTAKISDYDKATWLYYYSNYNFNIDKHDIAYENIVKSKKLFIVLKEEKDVIDCNMLMLDILGHQNELEIETQPILDEIIHYAENNKDTLGMKDVYYSLSSMYIDQDKGEEAIELYNKVIDLAKAQGDEERIAGTYLNISTVHQLTTPVNIDSSFYYIYKAIPIIIKHNNNQYLSYAYNNLGETYVMIEDYPKAIYYYKKADSVPLEKFVSKSKVVYYTNIADAYYKNKDYKNAAKYLQKKIQLQDSINDTQQNIAISSIKEKYDNEKLRADNLVSEAERIKNRNLLFTALAFLLFSLITGFLVYINRVRKHKITEKEKQLEQQKVCNLIKEQELIAIDAIIEGQEKERQLIASDLHDDLGALMATLQLNFENLNKHRNSKDSEMLFSSTKSLISEAYQKIRSIAQAKNSGVIAKQGLLKAITNNAEKISHLNGIQIEVRAYGLENRLQSSLELTLFRIVQELITNIIKHADATHAIIHFTNHKDSLNIMVEDDGKGFDIANISKSKGMGIRSIEKRVEFLGGTMTVESILGKGTSIIIDIPL